MLVSSQIKRRQWNIAAGLRSPYAILISVLLAIYVGIAHPAIAEAIAPVGNLYLGLLKMCVLPVLLSAITASLGRLMNSPDAKQYIRKVLIVFPVSLLIVSSVACLAAFILGPGRNLSEETLATLGVLVKDSSLDFEVSLSGGAVAVDSTPSMSDILMSFIPDNIFQALSEGQTLKVLCFSAMFGISLGLLKKEYTDSIFVLLDGVFKSFNQLMQWLTVLLPFGLFSLLSYQLSQQGLDVIASMLNFVLVTLFTFALIYVFCTLVIWKRSRQPLFTVLNALREPTVLALATASSFASMPSAIAALSEKLKFSRQTINLIVPLSITICRFGSVIYFALATLFVVQLYDKPLGPLEIFLVAIGAVVAGIASSGATGILTLTMLEIIFVPLSLPLEAVLILFIAIDPLIDPVRTLGIVHTAMAVATVISEEEPSQVEEALSGSLT